MPFAALTGYEAAVGETARLTSERRERDAQWERFIETQQYVTAATDFAQVEMLTPEGLMRKSLLFFMDIGAREVRLGGIVHDPDGNWTA